MGAFKIPPLPFIWRHQWSREVDLDEGDDLVMEQSIDRPGAGPANDLNALGYPVAVSLRLGADIEGLTIQALPTGDVALFKGRLWSPEAPIVHRSPPLAETGERRLPLVIDPVRDDARSHD